MGSEMSEEAVDDVVAIYNVPWLRVPSRGERNPCPDLETVAN